MKKQLLSICVAAAATMFFAGKMTAQTWEPSAYTIHYVEGAPTIDGDSSEWANVTASDLKVPYAAEAVSLIEEHSAYFKAVWNDTAVFVLVSAPDDNFYPAICAASNSTWLFDKPEIYFDVNASIVEGAAVTDNGPDNGNSGHFQWAPSYETDHVTNVAWMYQTDLDTTATGSTYFVEYAVGLQYLKSRAGDVLAPASDLVIGFDVTMIDLDRGKPNVIARLDWSNNTIDTRADGVAGESWASMDASGDMTFSETAVALVGGGDAVETVNYDSKAISPNVTSTTFAVNVDATNVVIINSIGQVVKEVNSGFDAIDVAELPAGMYIVRINNNTASKLLKR